ncbi:MAG: glucose-6-phosphate isomerase, partial [Lentisphaeria bacterium]|nr:glucose-6-phosphate isomerase [Lentisphaeria bacterium]
MEKNDFQKRCAGFSFTDGASAFSMNFAGMDFEESAFDAVAQRFPAVHSEMEKIELGEIKNPDENRKVTHFTDRSVYTGSAAFAEVEEFAAAIREGKITGSTGKKFESALINGIGGSALGPQLLQMAINGPYWNEKSSAKRNGNLKIYFLDNTDPSGLCDALEVCDLETLLVVNVSKSGGTQETKNNMLVAMQIFADAGIDFAKHACAITMKDSELDKTARGGNYLKVFEMAESIGGRTSETSIVGHLPAALAGIDFASLIRGACHMDALTRRAAFRENPAYMLAALWYIAGEGKGERNMVIVPYSDRLILFSRYLQQLVMESLGKEKDLDGNTVHQGLNVFGNKGGTDAHAFIQQLNDGRDDFFVTFIEVME